MVIKVKNADLLIRVGMDLDKWVQSLIDSARNSKIVRGKPGYLDASLNIVKMEVPTGKVDARMGDIHIYGNPHYWLDPENSLIILKDIYKKLKELLPDEEKYLSKNYSEYLEKFKSAYENWKKKMKPFAGKKVVAYHNSWPYFARRFKLKVVDFIETKPGIPPTPSHIISLIKKIKSNKIKLILVEPYFSLSAPSSVADATGCKIRIIPISSGGVKGTETYIKMINYTVNQLAKGLE
jgi:ABC-type Zn uptake system ZnuABC Zn-binding protein ZnuA